MREEASGILISDRIKVQKEPVSINETVEIHGRDFARVIECNDTNMGFACQSENVQKEVMQDVSIKLIQGSKNWRLAKVDPNQNYAFDRELRLPGDISTGQATLVAEGNYEPVETPIEIVE